MEEEAWQGPFEEELSSQLATKKVHADPALVKEVITKWRVQRQGKPLPRPGQDGYEATLASIIKTIRLELRNGTEHVAALRPAFEAQISTDVVRISRAASGPIVFYSRVAKEDEDPFNRIHPWVNRHVSKRRTEPFEFEATTPTLLKNARPTETIIWQNDEVVEG